MRTAQLQCSRHRYDDVNPKQDPATADVIVEAGFEITPSKPAELADFLKVEIVKWAKVVKDSGAKAE